MGKHPSHVFQVGRGKLWWGKDFPGHIPVEGKTLPPQVVEEASLFVRDRLGTGKSMAAQKKEQVNFSFDLRLALDLVNPKKKPASGCLQKVESVNRACGHTLTFYQPPETILCGDAAEILSVQDRIDCHVLPGMRLPLS